MRSGEQSFLLTTDYLWIWYGFWIMPYTKRSYSVFSYFPKYEASRHSWHVTRSLSCDVVISDILAHVSDDGQTFEMLE